MNKDNIAKLNEKGIKMFDGIFENNEVPILTLLTESAELIGTGVKEIYQVDISKLDHGVFDSLCLRISELRKSDYLTVIKYFKKLGFIPLRKELTEIAYSKDIHKFM